jgi:hypothetical protein
MRNLKYFINWGFLVVQFITAVLAILCWNRNKSIAWRIFVVVWILTFLTETVGKIMGSYHLHNLWLYNYFYTLFYPGIILIYTQIFFKSWLSWFAIIMAALLFVWSIIYLLTNNNTALDTPYALVASTSIIFLALIYLVQTSLDKQSTLPLRNDYYYWFSAGFFIYFTFHAIMFGMYTEILASKISWLSTFTFFANHLITLILHLCLWSGFRAALKWMK